MKLLKNKNGELTTQQIVFLVILITSFVVILFLFFRLNLGEVSNKEICHNSVVLKGKSVPGFGALDCRTNYLCVSGSGKCEGINPTQTIKVNSNNKDEVLKAIADEMIDCWWMFGEGKVDYAGSSLSGSSCAVCSIVRFDENFQEEITYKDLSDFLKKTNKDSSQSYFDYLFKKGEPEIMSTDIPISYTDQYNIITGRSDGIKIPFIGINIKDPKIVPVHFIKSSDLSQTQCTRFDITKA